MNAKNGLNIIEPNGLQKDCVTPGMSDPRNRTPGPMQGMVHQQFDNIIEFLPDATFVIDKDKRVVAWNRAIEKMTNLKKEDIIGKGDYEYALPFYRARRPILIDLIWMTDEEIESRYNYVERDGDMVFAETCITSLFNRQNVYLWAKTSPLYDEKGNMCGAIESIRDVTSWKLMEKRLQKTHDELEIKVNKRTQELKKANEILENEIAERRQVEEALKKAEEKYRNIFEHAVEGIFQTTPDGYFIGANPAIASILGYQSLEELINSINSIGTQLYVDPEHRTTFIRLLRENNTAQLFATQFYRKDGSIIWVSINARAVRDLNGNVMYFEGFLKDMTEYKRAEEALKESEERYRISIEHSNDGVVITRKNIYEYVNHKFMEIFGLKYFDEIIGKPTTEVVHPDDRDMVMKYFALRHQGEVAPSRYEFRGIKKDGTPIDIEVSVALINYKEGKAVLAYLRDITERKKMEEEYYKTKKLESVGILAGGIAHDFNNMLTAILGNISLAKMLINPEEKAFKLLDNAEKSSGHASNLTKRLITFSKGGAPIKKLVSTEDLIKSALKYFSSNFSIKCDYSFSKDLKPIMLDEGQIKQVVYNIILNAKEAMPEGGTINVSVENVTVNPQVDLSLQEGQYTRISIEDHGVGIPEENIAKIFDPHFSTKDMGPQKGMGLGLAVCYSIIKNHGGLIAVDSAVGQGSVFTIYLPVQNNG